MLITKSGDMAALLAGAQCSRCAKAKDCAVARGRCPYFLEESPQPAGGDSPAATRRANRVNERGAS